MYYDVSAVNSSCRNILAETTVNALVEVTGATHHEINGVNGEVILLATSVINGSGLCISGLKSEIRGTGTQTECDFLTCVVAKWNNAVTPTTGDSALFLGWSHTCAVDYGLMLQSEGSGSLTTAIGMATAVATNAFSFPADGTAPVAAGNYEIHGGTKVRISVLVGGSQYYMLASTAPTTQS